MGTGRIEIARASIADAEEILALQRLAYGSEAELYNDFKLPPLTQTLAELRADFERQVFLKATDYRRIVGSVRAFSKGGSTFIGRLIVHPEYQNRGIGTALMWKVEGEFGASRRFELFTGERSERNVRLYRRLGYEVFKKEQVSDSVTLVYMGKTVV